MKLSCILCLLVVSATVCLAQGSTTVDACIGDLKSDDSQIKEIAKSLTSLNLVKFKQELVAMSAQIDTTVAHCKSVEGLDIIAFAFEQLSMKQSKESASSRS